VAVELEASAGYGVTGECGILFSDLLKKRFPPEDWLVEGLITTGLSVLTDASKIGKSWAALQLVTALDGGGCLWGLLKPALSEAQRQIIDLLESEARNWTTAEIAETLDKGKRRRWRQKDLLKNQFMGNGRPKDSLQVCNPLGRCKLCKLPKR
jgi:hypothetical protein